MRIHRRRGRRGVLGRHCVEYLFVRLEGGLFSAGRPQRDRSLAGQPLDQGVVDRHEYRVARNLGQNVVESDVGALESSGVPARRSIGLKSATQLVDVLSAGLGGGEARHPDLKEGARLLEMSGSIGLRKKMSR